MPATSPASADELRTPEKNPATSVSAPLALWPDAARVLLRRIPQSIAAWFRRGWLYRQSLRGPITDRLHVAVSDPKPRRLEDADKLLRGRFRFAGDTVDVKEGTSIFDTAMPTEAFADAVQGFDWLSALAAAGGDAARRLALDLAAEWLDRNRNYTRAGWAPHVIARRFINLAAHGRFFLTNSDLLWRSKFFVTLRNQSRVLARTLPLAPEGMPRLEAAVGLVIAGLALNDDMSVAQGLTRLDGELARQFLPDGGHVGRSPEMLARSFQLLAMLTQGLEITGHVVPDSLRGALDRMALALRFFRMGDGGLSVVNGGGESDPRLVTSLLERSDIQGPPYGHSPHSGYQRLAAGRAIVVFDVGPPPPGPFSIEAHAGCLAFEFSSGNQRVVVNCGSARPDMERATENWATALRRTAAHSTLTLADTSSAVVLPAGFLRDTLGPQLFDGPQYVETAREELAEGTLATGKQDGYLVRFGIAHERRVVLSTKGHTLTGVDCLSPLPSRRGRGRRQPPVLNFAIRFHIHPDIRLSLAQNGGSVILKLPSGEGWRFRCGGGNLAIEESIYLGSGRVRRTEQLVVTGTVRDDVVECAWVFENMAAQ